MQSSFRPKRPSKVCLKTAQKAQTISPLALKPGKSAEPDTTFIFSGLVTMSPVQKSMVRGEINAIRLDKAQQVKVARHPVLRREFVEELIQGSDIPGFKEAVWEIYERQQSAEQKSSVRSVVEQIGKLFGR